jgi:hypothetical protein
MQTITECDICGTKIKDKKCNCGTWLDAEEVKNCPIRKSIEYFHEMKRFTLTADAPHLGCAVVFFRGDCNDVQKVQKFIYEMKNRPYYSDGN